MGIRPDLQNYVEILTSATYLTFFRNSAVVSVLVVVITMLVSIPAAFALSRMKFWGSATLATGVFLTYLIPEHAAVHPAVQDLRLPAASGPGSSSSTTGGC